MQFIFGPQFNSPSRAPTSSLGVYGATQAQSVTVVKAMLPSNFLAVRKLRNRGHEADCFGDFQDSSAAITDVIPHELVFTERLTPPQEDTMDAFVTAHPTYGKKFLTGGIQIEAFSAFNALRNEDEFMDRIVFVGSFLLVWHVQAFVTGVATSPQSFSSGITGFTVQTSGSVTIENLSPHTICSGDWIQWAPPEMEDNRPKYTVLGNPPAKALANIAPYRYADLRQEIADAGGAADGNFRGNHTRRVIGRALTNARPCQNFDIMLHT